MYPLVGYTYEGTKRGVLVLWVIRLRMRVAIDNRLKETTPRLKL